MNQQEINKQGLSVSSLFYEGKFFQVGDFLNGQGEFLNCLGSGFQKDDIGGQLTGIQISVDTVCNSLYLNHGITQTSIFGLGVKFLIDGKPNYAFEVCKFKIPYTVQEKKNYYTQYYNSEINSKKLDSLKTFLKKEFNIELSSMELKNIGTFMYKNQRPLFDYFFLCLSIRNGDYGCINHNNFSEIVFNVFKEKGINIHSPTDLIYKFTRG